MQLQPVPISVEEIIHLQSQLFDAVEQAILAIDLTGRIVFWNRFAERLYGWTVEEVRGQGHRRGLSNPFVGGVDLGEPGAVAIW